MNISDILLKRRLNKKDIKELEKLSDIEIKLLFMAELVNQNTINSVIIDFINDIKFLKNYREKRFYIKSYGDENNTLSANRIKQLELIKENNLKKTNYIKINGAVDKLNNIILDMIDLKKINYYISESLFCFEIDLGARFSSRNRYDYIFYNINSNKFYIVENVYTDSGFVLKEAGSSSISLIFRFMESKISKDRLYKEATYRKRRGKIFKNINELELMKELKHDKQREEFINNLRTKDNL